MDIQMPDGTLIQGVPDGTTKAQLAAKYSAHIHAAGGGEQSSLLQTAVASPIGRGIHDVIVKPVEGLASLGQKAIPTPFDIGGKINDWATGKIEGYYNDAVAAQRNRPGYADELAKAQTNSAKMPQNGFSDAVTAPFNPALAGALPAIFDGTNASNAAMDVQTGKQDDYAKAHPVLSFIGNLIGGLSAAPEGATAAAAVTPAIAKQAKQIAPTVPQLKAAAKAAYDQVGANGMLISDTAVKDMAADLDVKIGSRIDPTLHPDATAAFKRVQDRAAQGGGATFEDMDNLRRVVADAASATKPADKYMSRQILDHVDDFVDGLSPADIVGGKFAGNPQDTIDALNSARDLWSRASQAGTIQGKIDRAGQIAKGRDGLLSRSNLDGALRGEFQKLALNERAMARLSPAVREAVRQVGAGSNSNRALRLAGKLAPHGLVSGLSGAATGFTLGGPVGALAVPAAAELARMGASAISTNAARRALDIAALGKTAIPQVVGQPALRIPQITSRSLLPYGLITQGLTVPQSQ